MIKASSLYLTIPALFLIFSLSHCQSSKTGTSLSSEERTKAVGLYTEYCQGCHGPELQKFQNLNWKENLDIRKASEVIAKGMPDKGMPAYGTVMDENQIDLLSRFIMQYEPATNKNESIEDASGFELELVIGDLGIPWGMEFLPGGDMLIAEKAGRLLRLDTAGVLSEITGLPPVRDRGQGGLMDLKLHPDYSENGWLYISYVYIDPEDEGKGNTAIIRARIKDDRLVDKEQIYTAYPSVGTNYHFGCRMVFDRESYLYFTNGDRGKRDEFPQSLDNCNGKVHRLHDDGRIPKDNPFVNQENAVGSIYSYGHRNPQGIAMHPLTGAIWEHEHGPKGGDEINIIQKAQNYGWPVISYGINYNGTRFTDITEKEGMMQPVYYYVPSIAPCGMAFVTGDRYPGWENSILIGSLSFRYLERVRFEGTELHEREKLLEDLDSRVRDVRMGPDGYIYVAVEEPGRIYRLKPKSS